MTCHGGITMPNKDPERRREVTAEWRRRSHTKAYMRWLYERRALRFWKAETYERVLELISDGGHVGTASETAAMWLYEAKQKELAVGMFFDHDLDVPSNEPSRKGGRQLPAEHEEKVNGDDEGNTE